MLLASTLLGLMLALQAPPVTAPPSAEVISEVRIHGNKIATDDDVLKLSGIVIGAPFGATTVADITTRLEKSKQFHDVQVLKRFASIADPSKISVVIVVDEGPVRIDVPGIPGVPGGALRVVRRNPVTNLMWMPILDGEDGYGLTYGVRAAYVGVGGKRGRLSFPGSWGGLKQIGAEYDRTFVRGPFSRVQVGTSLRRRHNPAFDVNDDRKQLWTGVDRRVGPIRLGARVGLERVSFAQDDDTLKTAGVSVTYDTRLNPILPRNAVFATAEVERIAFDSGGVTRRTTLDGRGYLGVGGQRVLVARVLRESADRPLPDYLKSLLGGWSNLRGFKAGAFYGDSLVASSLELQVPTSSPLSVGQLGVSIFVDTGKAYAFGQKLADVPWQTGVGGGVWLTLAAFRLDLSVAHGRGATTRVNFGARLAF